MASLSIAKTIITGVAHAKLRDQIEGAMWMVAREKSGKVEGVESDLVVRILRSEPVEGKLPPHALAALRNFAYDAKLQDLYMGLAAGFTDAQVVDWVRDNWSTIAGIG